VEVRQLRYFVAVAEELSFSRAARRLNLSQPPLSVQIKAIEEQLGATLFDRDKRNVVLTRAGEVLLDQARGVLDHMERADEMVRRAVRGEAGRIVLGFTASVPMHDMFPRILRRFHALYPQAVVEARQMSTGAQLQALAARELDIGILRPASWFRPPAGLSVRRLWRDQLHVFLADDHPLLGVNEPIEPRHLVDEAFITFAADLGCGLAEHLAMICGTAGFRPRITHEAMIGASILGLVAAGVGVSLLPESHSGAGVVGVMNRPLAAADTESDLLLAHREDNFSPVLRRFLEVATEVAPAPSAATAAPIAGATSSNA
jgi:DNA-binding transcriptional LysR family regulator